MGILRATIFGLWLMGMSACGGGAPAPSGNASVARAERVGSGVCPSPDPTRDGPLVDAIRRDDARSVEALLARTPEDTRARAALAVISGQGTPDPNEVACFAPYL
ncbi:MAG: hypothetical protein AAFY65_03495 [Pseudomonadota bacterium]